MPRKKPPPIRPGDFRTPAVRAADAKLDGTWWRCRLHGLTFDAVILGGAAYCPDDGCLEKMIVAHSVMEERTEPGAWNASFGAKRGVTTEDLG